MYKVELHVEGNAICYVFVLEAQATLRGVGHRHKRSHIQAGIEGIL